MKNCDWCHRSPEKCCCTKIVLEHCKLCLQENSRYFLEWIGRPNPAGVDRGAVFSHFECKDKKACADTRGMIVTALNSEMK
jgi:hypothetical protein